jgi:hypothetical protein
MIPQLNLLPDRQCGTCTKCCEGSLSGSAYGIPFYKGKPCHFLIEKKGCGIYKDRPNDPCKTYSCEWLKNKEIPEWLKPERSNVIIDVRHVGSINYLNLVEAGEVLPSNVLSWAILYAMQNGLNLRWEVNGSLNWIGSPEFLEEMNKQKT